MKKKVRQGLSLLFLGVCVFSTAMYLGQLEDNRAAAETYAGAAELAFAKEEVPTSAPKKEAIEEELPAPVEEKELHPLAELDLTSLKEKNPEVLGWIRIPESPVDYPLMQGADNNYYLYHTWDKESNDAGSIYLDYRNDGELKNFNSILYGHNRDDGSMFSSLLEYQDAAYEEAHPNIYLAVGEELLSYEILTAFETDSLSKVYTLGLNQQDSREQYLQEVLAPHLEEGELPEAEDHLLTLSTCSGLNYEKRWVVVARKIQ